MPAQAPPIPSAPAGPGSAEATRSLSRDAWLRPGKNRLAVAGLWILAGLALVCVFGPILGRLPAAFLPAGLSHSYAEQDLAARIAPPSARHWLGTDQLGRDVLARLMTGG